ncbi:MAG: hypothetical protein MN733_26180, partial [Nitrososphaera sp.]|nr:hypothetical protein [Nitrososphaera sp.]
IRLSDRLRFRNTILVYLEIASEEVCRDIWLYIHTPKLQTGRITNFRNWVPGLYKESPNTILAMEFWCYDEDCLWHRDDKALTDLAKSELLASGLVTDINLVLNTMVHRVHRSYPVYHRGYKGILEPIQRYLGTVRDLQVIGRYGAFKYNNQDHSLLMGLLASENIMFDQHHNLWAINSDFDCYQEDYGITESGLVRLS